MAAALGCTGSAPMRVRPYNPLAGREQAGAVYFLPKSRIEVGFTVKLDADIDGTRCESIVSECKYNFDVPEITNVTIGTQQMPDPRAGFVIETSQDFITETNFEGSFSPKGELTSVAAAEQDHTLEFVTEGLGAITKLASIVAMAGPTQATTLQAQLKRRRTLLSLLAKSDAALAEARPCIGAPQANAPPPPCVTTDDLHKTLELRGALLKEINELNGELSVSKDVRIQCAFEPTKRLGSVDLRKDGGVCPAYTALKLKLAQIGFDVPLPALTVQWQSTSATDKPTGEKGGAEPPPRTYDTSYEGIVYRIPEWFSVTVSKSSHGDEAQSADSSSTSGDVVAIAGDIVALPQFGKLMATSFDKADLRTGKELKIELHEGLGSLKRLSFKATPPDPKQVKQLLDAIPLPKQAPPPVLVDETTRIQEETRRVLAEKAYLDALKELEGAKQQPEKAPPKRLAPR
jgi:hypothetical protein